MLCCVVLCCVVLCCVVLCCVVLCCVVLCCVVLSFVVSFVLCCAVLCLLTWSCVVLSCAPGVRQVLCLCSRCSVCPMCVPWASSVFCVSSVTAPWVLSVCFSCVLCVFCEWSMGWVVVLSCAMSLGAQSEGHPRSCWSVRLGWLGDGAWKGVAGIVGDVSDPCCRYLSDSLRAHTRSALRSLEDALCAASGLSSRRHPVSRVATPFRDGGVGLCWGGALLPLWRRIPNKKNIFLGTHLSVSRYRPCRLTCDFDMLWYDPR